MSNGLIFVLQNSRCVNLSHSARLFCPFGKRDLSGKCFKQINNPSVARHFPDRFLHLFRYERIGVYYNFGAPRNF